VFREMAIGRFVIRINNRKVLKGILRHFDIGDEAATPILRALDKIEKEDQGGILAELERNGLPANSALELYNLVGARRGTDEALALLAELAYPNETYVQGVQELAKIVEAIRQFGVPDSAFAIDLSVVRGLDYYTGTIYETTLLDHPDIGSICSGGRYDDLASYFTNTRLPGVGISIGLTRLFWQLREAGLLGKATGSTVQAMVALMDADSLPDALDIARRLRAAGINTEMQMEARKIGKQFQYASRAGIRFVVLTGEDEEHGGVVAVKDLLREEQFEVAREELASTLRVELEQAQVLAGR